MNQEKTVEIIETENKDIIVEFKAIRGNDCISGYMHLEDADDPECLHFYDAQGFECGTKVPRNPHKEYTSEWENYETLLYEFQSDSQVIQFLCDFAEENRTFTYDDSYILQINEGASVEATYERCNRSTHQAEHESFMGKLKLTFNGKNFIELLDDDRAVELSVALSEEFDATISPSIKNGYFIMEMPKSIFPDDSSYEEDDVEDILNEYKGIAAEYLCRQFVADLNIANDFGDMVEQSIEETYLDDWNLYRLSTLDSDNVKQFLIDEGFELENEAGIDIRDSVEITIKNAEEVLTKTVKASGNSGRVYVPASWVGREIKCVLLKDDEQK